jgi:hypothetical protein
MLNNAVLEQELFLCYAPINVKPRGGRGRATPGEFDIFNLFFVNFPTLGLK